MEYKQAIDTLKKAFKEDPDLAHSWHANIAMAFYDSMDENHTHHKDRMLSGNEAASRFMKLFFDVETSKDMLFKKQKPLEPC